MKLNKVKAQRKATIMTNTSWQIKFQGNKVDQRRSSENAYKTSTNKVDQRSWLARNVTESFDMLPENFCQGHWEYRTAHSWLSFMTTVSLAGNQLNPINSCFNLHQGTHWNFRILKFNMHGYSGISRFNVPDFTYSQRTKTYFLLKVSLCILIIKSKMFSFRNKLNV